MNSSPTLPTQKIISGFSKEIIRFLVRGAILKILLTRYKNLLTTFRVIDGLKKRRISIHGNASIKKVAKVGGHFFWDLYSPGYGSQTFVSFIEGEGNRIIKMEKKTNRFTNVFIAVTKKCSLQCEHCFEWDSLNKKEKLSAENLSTIVEKLIQQGTSQIQLTGGEPMLRMNDILGLLLMFKQKTDFWILTSGLNLTDQNACKLKQAGLTGVVISLDHFEPIKHNAFRGFTKAYEWAETAAKNSIANHLVTAFSLCATKEFVTEENLMEYARLANKIGVSFIQVLEPKAVGHYQGKDVALSIEQEKMLEDFYWKLNHDKGYEDYPIVCYHGFYQRRTGCFAAGDRNIYVDTNGDMQACPFCHSGPGNSCEDMESSIKKIQLMGCSTYQGAMV